ncbi:MAG: hydroxymyristoyl-ACP dehydratase [Robiginitalea sp.]
MPQPDFSHIIERLPYAPPFLFVDGITRLDSERVEGHYHFRADSPFYEGHFKGAPVTPGVLLTECCAQIGLVCMGIHLQEGDLASGEIAGIALSEAQMEFLQPVYPGETVRVKGQRIYYRFGKLKSAVRLYNEAGVLACRGTLAGMIKRAEK